MEDPIRTHSKPARPSKLTQTFSSLKGIIRAHGRKAHDDTSITPTTAGTTQSNHPYLSTRRNRDSMKPYMSQPLLGIPPTASSDALNEAAYLHEFEESDHSTSITPEHSPARTSLHKFPPKSPGVKTPTVVGLPESGFGTPHPNMRSIEGLPPSNDLLAFNTSRSSNHYDSPDVRELSLTSKGDGRALPSKPHPHDSPAQSDAAQIRTDSAALSKGITLGNKPMSQKQPKTPSKEHGHAPASGVKSLAKSIVSTESKTSAPDISSSTKKSEDREDNSLPVNPPAKSDSSATTGQPPPHVLPTSTFHPSALTTSTFASQSADSTSADTTPQPSRIIAPKSIEQKPSSSSSINLPPAIMATTSSPLPTSGAFAPSSLRMPPPSSTSTSSRRNVDGAPRLNLPPPNHRFSLTINTTPLGYSLSTGATPGIFSHGVSSSEGSGSARLSPSVILRSPPLPLLRLPTFSRPSEGSSSASGDNKKKKKVGLKSMPALPLQGTSRGAGGQEEVDDMDEEEDDTDEEVEEDEDDENDEDGNESTIQEDLQASRSSMSSTTSSMTMTSSASTNDDESSLIDIHQRAIGHTNRYVQPEMGRQLSRSSSYETARSSPSDPPSPNLVSTNNVMGPDSPLIQSSPLEPYYGDPNRPAFKRFSRAPHLPKVDTSRIDFSFLDREPPTADFYKGKHKSTNEDAGRTPVASKSSSYTPWQRPASGDTAMTDYFHQGYRESRSASEQTVKGARETSPTRTPRASDQPFKVEGLPTPASVLQGGGGLSRRTPIGETGTGIGTGAREKRLSSLSQHPGMYKRASQSMIEVHALETKEKVEQLVREREKDAEEEDRVMRRKSFKLREMRNSLRVSVVGAGVGDWQPPTSPVGKRLETTAEEVPLIEISECNESTMDEPIQIQQPPFSADALLESGGEESKRLSKRISMAPAYDSIPHPHPMLRRRRSMPMFNPATAPPPYPDFPPPAFAKKGLPIIPHEDEGNEKLPSYSNSIYLKAIMPRKMEFSEPGVPARDRKWRRVVCVLEGTSLKIYKPPSPKGVKKIGSWWQSKVGAGDASETHANATMAYHTKERQEQFQRQVNQRRAAGPGVAQQGQRVGLGSGVVPAPIGDGGITLEARSNPNVEGDREREASRTLKQELGVGDTSQPVLQIGSPTLHQRQAYSQQQYSPPLAASRSQIHLPQSPSHSVAGATRSALSVAVALLKPGSKHSRSNSDVLQTPSRPRTPRSSLNIPRSGRETPTSSSQATTGSLRSPSPSPTHLTTLAQSISSSSRPTTPVSRLSSQTPPPSTSQSSAYGNGLDPAALSLETSTRRPPFVTLTSAPPSKASKAKAKKSSMEEIPDPSDTDLIREYTMQHAESGVGNDYKKREHVIRVRLEGEQFLLQGRDVEDVIRWIEGLQSATNIALDLDERPMPRGPIYPRRRRRRRVVTVNTNMTVSTALQTGETGVTPVTATQLAVPLR